MVQKTIHINKDNNKYKIRTTADKQYVKRNKPLTLFNN